MSNAVKSRADGAFGRGAWKVGVRVNKRGEVTDTRESSDSLREERLAKAIADLCNAIATVFQQHALELNNQIEKDLRRAKRRAERVLRGR